MVGKDDAPGIVVLQEWWGVDYEIKNHAIKISQLEPGFKALIPEYAYVLFLALLNCFYLSLSFRLCFLCNMLFSVNLFFI